MLVGAVKAGNEDGAAHAVGRLRAMGIITGDELDLSKLDEASTNLYNHEVRGSYSPSPETRVILCPFQVHHSVERHVDRAVSRIAHVRKKALESGERRQLLIEVGRHLLHLNSYW